MKQQISKRLTHKDIWTVPNVLSLLRLLIVPVFLILYFRRLYIYAFAVLLFSALTDVADGQIARRCSMVSDVGKFLDPLADKVTQLSVLLCLAASRRWLFVLVGLFGIKELSMFFIGFLVLRKTDCMPHAHWYGKAATVLFDLSLAFAVLLPSLPDWVLAVLFGVCLAMALFSLSRYLIYDLHLLRPSTTGEPPVHGK